ncbi:heme-binding protein [Burkholderia multivorans]|nr:heme-binding protein [Burkholderia multivorans]
MAAQEIQLIDWDTASRLISEVVREATEAGIRVCVAIVDASGVPIASYRMPGAFLHSIDIALDKAFTAVSFGASTRDIAGLLEAQPVRVRDGLLVRPRFIAIGGGTPLICGGKMLGALGVSGGTEDEDMNCIQLALEKVWV